MAPRWPVWPPGVRDVAKGQTQGTPAKKIDELIAYGERSRFVTSIRVPVAERHSPDEFGLTFHVLTPLQDSVGIITPSSLFYTATHRGAFVPDIDPARASPDDPRHGGPAAGLHHGRAEAAPVRVAHSLHRVPGKPRQADAQNRSGNARIDQLRRMDRRAAVPAAQGGRRAKRGVLDRRRRRGRSEGRVEHPARQGDGRLHGVLRA